MCLPCSPEESAWLAQALRCATRAYSSWGLLFVQHQYFQVSCSCAMVELVCCRPHATDSMHSILAAAALARQRCSARRLRGRFIPLDGLELLWVAGSWGQALPPPDPLLGGHGSSDSSYGGVGHFSLPGSLNGTAGTLHLYFKARRQGNATRLRGFVVFDRTEQPGGAGLEMHKGPMGISRAWRSYLRLSLRSRQLGWERGLDLFYRDPAYGELDVLAVGRGGGGEAGGAWQVLGTVFKSCKRSVRGHTLAAASSQTAACCLWLCMCSICISGLLTYLGGLLS